MSFSTLTACGGDCTDCKKRREGLCPGCIEADGYVPEWAESGRCKIHACAKEHGARFCGSCREFPCEKLPKLIHWLPNAVWHLKELREKYKDELSAE